MPTATPHLLATRKQTGAQLVRNLISLIDTQRGEGKAHSCDIACNHRAGIIVEIIGGGRGQHFEKGRTASDLSGHLCIWYGDAVCEHDR